MNGERLLVFTRTTGFRHDSIPDAISAVRHIAAESGLEVDATEDPAVFRDGSLSSYRAAVFRGAKRRGPRNAGDPSLR
ncbi:MAG: ThuA domain-containing protein, partial [Acidobacteriota bacterium]